MNKSILTDIWNFINRYTFPIKASTMDIINNDFIIQHFILQILQVIIQIHLQMLEHVRFFGIKQELFYINLLTILL